MTERNNVDTSTAQILVFGLIVLAFGVFAPYMDIRQKQRDDDEKKARRQPAPRTSLL